MGRGSKVEVVGDGSRCYEGNPCLVSWYICHPKNRRIPTSSDIISHNVT